MVDIRSLGPDSLAVARRYRRQYAADASPRAARRPGLVRSAQLPAEPAARVRHSLEPDRRPADRRPDPVLPPVHQQQLGGAARLRDRAVAAAVDRDARHRRDRAAIDQPLCVATGGRVHGRRDRRDADVHARADRSSRLAARHAEPDRRGTVRSERASRRGNGWYRERGVAVDRARTAPLRGDGGGDHRLALGVGPVGSRAAVDLCADAGRWQYAGVCAVRVERQSGDALRCADAGVAERDDRGGDAVVPARAVRAGFTRDAAGAGCRCRRGDRRRVRAGVPAVSGAARGDLARAATRWTMSARPSRSTSTASASGSRWRRCRSSA
jgi:hypothetical protein